MEIFFDNRRLYDKPCTSCPLCRSAEIGRLYTIETKPYPFGVDKCSSCGFIFMNPRFNDETLKSFYGEGYYTGNNSYAYIDERRIKEYSNHVWNGRIEKIRKYSKDGNFLDIGASFGGFLDAAMKCFTPYGIEISEYAGEYLKKTHGEKIHIGSLYDHPFRSRFFSVITMIEVIEHLSDPVFAVKECHRLLADNGLMVIQTANMNGMQAKILKDHYAYFMPGHVSYFTKENLSQLLKNTGFRKIIAFHPVDFGLLPKLLKSRHSFKSAWEYRRWLRIIFYHLLGKINIASFSATSSMVIYAIK